MLDVNEVWCSLWNASCETWTANNLSENQIIDRNNTFIVACGHFFATSFFYTKRCSLEKQWQWQWQCCTTSGRFGRSLNWTGDCTIKLEISPLELCFFVNNVTLSTMVTCTPTIRQLDQSMGGGHQVSLTGPQACGSSVVFHIVVALCVCFCRKRFQWDFHHLPHFPWDEMFE